MNKKEIERAVQGYKQLTKLQERIEFLENKLDNLDKYVKKQTMPKRHYKN